VKIRCGSKAGIIAVVAALTSAGCTGESEEVSSSSARQINSTAIDFNSISYSVNGTNNGTGQSDITVTSSILIAPRQQVNNQSNTSRSLPECDSSESDPDGDGFGYENDTSCLVTAETNRAASDTNLIDETTQQSNNQDDSGESSEQNVRICTGLTVDFDGDGYGFENGTSCLIRSVVQNQGIDVSKSPTDTDNFPDNLHRVTDVILTAGQSNAFANGTRFEPDIYPEDRIDDRILVWTQNNGWKVANPLNQIWEHEQFPARPWDPWTSSNSPGFQIARAIVDADPERVVAFIPTSTPGQAIHHWRYGAAPYNAIKQRVENALNDIPHKFQLDLIWWMQGESDANASDYYRNTLNELINNWRSEPWYGNDKYFIANETIRFEVNQIFQELRNNDDPYTDYSAAAGLPSIKPNGNHFNSQSYRIIGNRVQQVYLDMRRATGAQ